MASRLPVERNGREKRSSRSPARSEPIPESELMPEFDWLVGLRVPGDDARGSQGGGKRTCAPARGGKSATAAAQGADRRAGDGGSASGSDSEDEDASDGDSAARRAAVEEHRLRQKRRLKEPLSFAPHEYKRKPEPKRKKSGRKHPETTHQWTQKEKDMVIRAHIQGGRKKRAEVAEMLGVSLAATDGVMKRMLHGDTHEGEKGAAEKRAAAPAPGNVKLTDELRELILHWLHLDCSLTNKEIAEMVNREIYRDCLISAGVELTEEQRKPEGPLPEQEDLHDMADAILERFNSRKVYAEQTIGKWVHSFGYTRKHILRDKTTANTPDKMAKRKRFCQRMLVETADPDCFLVFLDEMPFYLDGIRSSGGRVPESERAVLMTHSCSRLSYRTHVAMAVHPTLGLLHSGAYKPEVMVKGGKDEQRPRRTVDRATWGHDKYLEFMDSLLVVLADTPAAKGKHIYIVIDGASEHGKATESVRMLMDLPNFPAAQEHVIRNGGDFGLVKLPAASPQLNLCEYYNRALRSKVTSKRDDLEVAKRVLHGGAKGDSVAHRVKELADLIDSSLAELRDAQPQSSQKMMAFYGSCANHGGYLDVRERMS